MVSFTTLPLYPGGGGSILLNALRRRVVEPYSRSGCSGEQNNISFLLEVETHFLCYTVHSVFANPTALSWLSPHPNIGLNAFFIKFYSYQLMHIFIQLCISLLNYIKIT